MINDNPLEEGVDNQRTQEDFIFEELAALNYLMTPQQTTLMTIILN